MHTSRPSSRDRRPVSGPVLRRSHHEDGPARSRRGSTLIEMNLEVEKKKKCKIVSQPGELKFREGHFRFEDLTFLGNNDELAETLVTPSCSGFYFLCQVYVWVMKILLRDTHTDTHFYAGTPIL